MGKKAVLSALVLIGSIFVIPASALAFNQQLTVYASVEPTRAVYVNTAGKITKISGNTDQNINPKVFDENNQPLALTDAISQQYQQFLTDHHGHLQASRTYEVNPLSVDTAPNHQTIMINTVLTLGSDQSG